MIHWAQSFAKKQPNDRSLTVSTATGDAVIGGFCSTTGGVSGVGSGNARLAGAAGSSGATACANKRGERGNSVWYRMRAEH